MKFYLKVHSIIGGAPGEPGSGGVPGGDIGFGGGSGGFGVDEGFGYGSLFGSLLFGLPGMVVGGAVGAAAALAQGDPNPALGTGVSGPGGGIGVGGGPAAFRTSTIAQKAIQQAIAPPVAPIPAIPKPEARKRRVGRQETILTSALSDAPVYKPTLLGQ